jgi:hypothetical protein
MALAVLVVCVFINWVLSTFFMAVPHVLGLLVPPHWLLLGGLVALVTWFMRD